MKKLLLVVLCLANLVACTTPTQPPIHYSKIELPIQSNDALQLQAAEIKWQKNRPIHYSYWLQRTCFCPREYNSPIEIRVLNESVQKAMLPLDHDLLPLVRMDEALTIKDLFAVIHKALAKKAAKIDVKYDWRYGYPTSIAIDWDKMIADEETYFTAKYLKAY
ncbi:DUF6174 domain-containing protein [Crenothrix polyspora]|jgi:Family of unknown function (DUF6174)|uniref:Lipoprotein n=1 Tax=Crenothrix polyspora TaxID=360316 RepID=A0A1R4H7N3_9GAMM|nr:DUF6174 domain-containing protein [Crenothrix polyspora]SJM92177.1 exported hypothetical protein [Crenothrix polyspora]